jgi:hypothetical protein
MAVKLLIRDGNPYWWLSPDIWVVPGNDPNGAPAAPVAGQNAYLWAHVANTGSSDANGVRIDFFWANPALQVLRSTATLIGSAYGDIPAGGNQDVLCLVPWIPVIVNGGHECVVAVANHSGDPLPVPPPDDFGPPTYDQVAQRNLSVLIAAPQMMPMMLSMGAPQREDKTARIKVEIGGTVDREILQRLDGYSEAEPFVYFVSDNAREKAEHIALFLEWGAHEAWPNSTGRYISVPNHNGVGTSFLPAQVKLLDESDSPFLYYGGHLGDPAALMRHKMWLGSTDAVDCADLDPYIKRDALTWPPVTPGCAGCSWTRATSEEDSPTLWAPVPPAS